MFSWELSGVGGECLVSLSRVGPAGAGLLELLTRTCQRCY